MWGIDAAESLLGIARERVAAADFRHADLEELPFPDGTFDVVTGFNSFQFAANPVAALAEARRVPKPAGRIVVLTWGSPQGMEAAGLARRPSRTCRLRRPDRRERSRCPTRLH